jgi:hypothetical protein
MCLLVNVRWTAVYLPHQAQSHNLTGFQGLQATGFLRLQPSLGPCLSSNRCEF